METVKKYTKFIEGAAIKNYKTMKVFDCQQMPENIRRAFFNNWDHAGNDVLLEYYEFQGVTIPENHMRNIMVVKYYQTK